MIRFALIGAILLGAALSAAAREFEVEKIAAGVYAVIRNEPASLWFNPNNLFIIGSESVTVIDSNISGAHTREVLAELRKITRKPVKFVINTHWHEDHIIGNRVYRDAFPDVEFIGHSSTLKDLPTIGAENRKGAIENGAGFAEALKKAVAAGKNLAGKPITAEERLGYLSDAKLVESYLAESRDFKIILPSRTIDDRLVMHDGKRSIEILFLGRAHTGGDLVVHLPKERIVASGDLIVHPIPLVGSTAFPLEYSATLEKLLSLGANTIVPGHGPVMRDERYARRMIALLGSIKNRSESNYSRNLTLDQFRKRIDLSDFANEFAGDSQLKRFVFENYVTLSATAAAFKQLSEK